MMQRVGDTSRGTARTRGRPWTRASALLNLLSRPGSRPRTRASALLNLLSRPGGRPRTKASALLNLLSRPGGRLRTRAYALLNLLSRPGVSRGRGRPPYESRGRGKGEKRCKEGGGQAVMSMDGRWLGLRRNELETLAPVPGGGKG